MTTKCAWPNCSEEGEFPAPIDPRDLSKRQKFCKKHIKEFNKKWNGLDGFNADELESIQFGDATWNRPTWPLGTNPFAQAETITFESADDLYDFFKQRTSEPKTKEKQAQTSQELPADVAESCIIFDLKSPPTKPDLKKIYLKLVKRHHPDVNNSNAKAEDYVKRINVAYQILKNFIA